MSETYEQMEARRRAMYDAQHPRHKKTPKGYENNVPCPWCGKHNNFVPVVPKEDGLIVDCDHCGNLMTIVKVIQKPIIAVQQCHEKHKPPYEPRNRDEWQAEQDEAARVAEVNREIDAKENS